MKLSLFSTMYWLSIIQDKRDHIKTIVWTNQRPNKAIMANQRNNANQIAIQRTNFVDS